MDYGKEVIGSSKGVIKGLDWITNALVTGSNWFMSLSLFEKVLLISSIALLVVLFKVVLSDKDNP